MMAITIVTSAHIKMVIATFSLFLFPDSSLLLKTFMARLKKIKHYMSKLIAFEKVMIFISISAKYHRLASIELSYSRVTFNVFKMVVCGI
jgi:hypothetical protein